MWRIRAALSPNRPLPQGQDLDEALAFVESTADVNNRVSSEQNKLGSVRGFRKGDVFFSFLFFFFFTLLYSAYIVPRGTKQTFVRWYREEEGGKEKKKKRNKRGHKSRGVKRFRLVGDNSVSETISFL